VTSSWTILGAPLDSSGTGRGEERGPAALRAAGIALALDAHDDGDVTGLLRPAQRDPATGVIAAEALRAASTVLAEAVAVTLRAGRRPLVLGGDCSLLPGAIAGCRAAGEAPGLWMLDGHPDMLDGASSPTGEAADMDLATVLADGLVAPEHIGVLGLRPAGHDPENDAELAAIPPSVTWQDTDAITTRGATATAVEAERRLAADPGTAWLHLDLDVLDEAAMPAVTYRQPRGLSWDALAELLAPLARSPALVGMSVSDLEPDRDPDGSIARRVVALLAAAVAGP